jgi:hypothetical protein
MPWKKPKKCGFDTRLKGYPNEPSPPASTDQYINRRSHPARPLGALSAKAANGGRRRPSRHELADNLATDVSKPEVAALEAVGQLGVVESKQV